MIIYFTVIIYYSCPPQEGSTALHLATWTGHKDVVSRLLGAKIDAQKRNLVSTIQYVDILLCEIIISIFFFFNNRMGCRQ